MKIFRFVEKVFFIGLTILSNFTNATLLIVCNNKQRWNKKNTDVNAKN